MVYMTIGMFIITLFIIMIEGAVMRSRTLKMSSSLKEVMTFVNILMKGLKAMQHRSLYHEHLLYRIVEATNKGTLVTKTDETIEFSHQAARSKQELEIALETLLEEKEIETPIDTSDIGITEITDILDSNSG